MFSLKFLSHILSCLLLGSCNYDKPACGTAKNTFQGWSDGALYTRMDKVIKSNDWDFNYIQNSPLFGQIYSDVPLSSTESNSVRPVAQFMLFGRDAGPAVRCQDSATIRRDEFGCSRTSWTQKVVELKSQKFDVSNYRIFELILSMNPAPPYLFLLLWGKTWGAIHSVWLTATVKLV